MPRAMSLRGEAQYSALPRRISSKARTLKRASRIAPIACRRARRVRLALVLFALIAPRYAFSRAVPAQRQRNTCRAKRASAPTPRAAAPILAAARSCRGSRSAAKYQQGQKMNWERIEGNWKQFKGNAKQQWGKITDSQLEVISGKRDLLAGRIQEAYGVSKDEAEKQLSAWQQAQHDVNAAH